MENPVPSYIFIVFSLFFLQQSDRVRENVSSYYILPDAVLVALSIFGDRLKAMHQVARY